MATQEPVTITADMLAAIRAVVLRVKSRRAAGVLLLWGVLNLLGWFVSTRVEAGEFPAPSLLEEPLAAVLYYGVGVLGLGMLASGTWALTAGHPRVIWLAGISLMLVGIWNLVFPFLLATSLGLPLALMLGENVRWLIVGVLQLFWGLREQHKYRLLEGWLPQTALIGREQRVQTAKLLKRFVRQEESFECRRLRATVAERGALGQGVPTGCRGVLLDGLAMLIGKQLQECLVWTPQDAFAGHYAGEGVKLRTDQGERRLKLGNVSVVLLKRWAGVPLTEKDLQRAIRKKPSLAVVESFLNGPQSDLRVAALRALNRFRKDAEAPALAVARLDDPDGAVRSAALDVCAELKVEGLHPWALAMLKEDDARARRAAAAYVAVFPTADVSAIRTAMDNEQDKVARKDLAKALAACQALAQTPAPTR